MAKRTAAKRESVEEPVKAKRGRPRKVKEELNPTMNQQAKEINQQAKEAERGRPRKSKTITEAVEASSYEGVSPALYSVQLGQQNMKVLDHVLNLLKAQVFDAFRQFTAGAIHAGQVPNLNSFLYLFKASITLHGITPEQLVAALDPTEQDIVMEALEATAEAHETSYIDSLTTEPKKKESDKPKAPADNMDLSGFGIDTAKIDDTPKKVEAVLKEAPAQSEPFLDFSSPIPQNQLAATTEEPAPKSNGVFSSLDVL